MFLINAFFFFFVIDSHLFTLSSFANCTKHLPTSAMEISDVIEASTPPAEEVHAAFAPAETDLPQNTTPLLSNTPPTITRALSKAYPFISLTDKFLSLLTWTSDDPWKSFLLVISWITLVLYYDTIIGLFAYPVYIGLILALYLYIQTQALIVSTSSTAKSSTPNPTLDEIVQTLSNLTLRINLFLAPLDEFFSRSGGLSKIALKVTFLSPAYFMISFYLLSAKSMLLIVSVYILTYHSMHARVTRAILWRSSTVRKLAKKTGLFDESSNSSVKYNGSDNSNNNNNQYYELTEHKPTSFKMSLPKKQTAPRFTYVIYENQRRWIGLGWSTNLFSYERAPWTDEFLEPVLPVKEFVLPETDDSTVEWHWIGNWKLDLTNDGGLTLPPDSKTRSIENPGPEDGWVYFDNTWKKPAMGSDSFVKYTRRRRWLRTAELVKK